MFCEKSNPRGTCCTEDLTRFLADYGMKYNVGESSCGDSSTDGSCGNTSQVVKKNSSCCENIKTETKEISSSCC